MDILETIIEHKKKEVANRKANCPAGQLEKAVFFNRQPLSMAAFLKDPAKTGIIAEFKRRSPSRGVINAKSSVEQVTRAYTIGGAAGLSVLTDEHFFGGSDDDLREARVNEIPILRKDFIIDPYQLIEAKAMGADMILLIAACLDPVTTQNLAIFARGLQLEVLLEIHNERELQHLCDEVDVVGVNNRDLKTFNVDINLSVQLAGKIPANKIRISESGISDTQTIGLLKKSGYHGFLMGENFMKQEDPAIAFASFVNQLKSGTT